MAHVQREEDEDEIVAELNRQQEAQLKAIAENLNRARVRAAEAVERDKFRASVRAKARAKARATSGSKRPRHLSPWKQQQEEEEDLLLIDVVDEYSAALSTTIYVTNLHPQVTEATLRTSFAEAGRIVDVYLPKDRAAKHHRGCAFVEYSSQYAVDNAMADLNMSTLFGNTIKVIRVLRVKEKSLDVGPNIFLGYLDADMDENKLYALFSELGVTVKHIKIMKDPDTGISLGSAFLNFDSYEASSRAVEAIETINDKYPQCCPVVVFYASMKDTEGLRRHDAPTERMLPSGSNPDTQFASFSQPAHHSWPNLNQVPDIFTWPPFPQHAQWYPSMQMPMPMPMPVPPQFSTMHPLPQWQQPQGMPPQHLQQFWPSPLNMPQLMNWPPPPPAGMSSQHVGWAPPLPQQLAGGHGHHSMMQMSMAPPPPPPPPSNAQHPPPLRQVEGT